MKDTTIFESPNGKVWRDADGKLHTDIPADDDNRLVFILEMAAEIERLKECRLDLREMRTQRIRVLEATGLGHVMSDAEWLTMEMDLSQPVDWYKELREEIERLRSLMVMPEPPKETQL